MAAATPSTTEPSLVAADIHHRSTLPIAPPAATHQRVPHSGKAPSNFVPSPIATA